MVTCGADKSIRLWNADNGTLIKKIDQQVSDALYSVDFSPDGSKIIAGGLGKTWHLWNTGEDAPLKTVPGHSDHIYRTLFNSAGTRIATLGYAGNFMVWNAADGNQLFAQQLPVSTTYSFAYAPDGKSVAFGTIDNKVILFTLPPSAQ